VQQKHISRPLSEKSQALESQTATSEKIILEFPGKAVDRVGFKQEVAVTWIPIRLTNVKRRKNQNQEFLTTPLL
jgi:hypothetical protein